MKKSIAALLAIALVLTSLFTVNLITFAEDTTTTTVGKLAVASAVGENQSNSGQTNNYRTKASSLNLSSSEPLYTAGYTSVVKYDYNMLQDNGEYYEATYEKYLSTNRPFSFTDGYAADTVADSVKYIRLFVRVPCDTTITVKLAGGIYGWDSRYTKTNIPVKAVSGGAGYSELIIPVTLDLAEDKKSINAVFVYPDNGVLAKECSTIYVGAVELWDSEPTAVLTATEETAPEWLLTTNNSLHCATGTTYVSHSSADKYDTYWQSAAEASTVEIKFDSQEAMENFYASSEPEFRFQVNTKTGYIASSIAEATAPTGMSNFVGAFISVWIKVPKNMKLAIGPIDEKWGRYFTTVTVNVTEENDGWQEIRVPINNSSTNNIQNITIKPVGVTDYTTAWNYGESLYVSWPQIVKNVEFSDGSALAEDTVAFGESTEKTFTYSTCGEDSSNADATGAKIGLAVTKNVTVCEKNGISVSLATGESAVDYYRNTTPARKTNGIYFTGATVTQQQYDYGYLKFYIQATKSLELRIVRYGSNYNEYHTTVQVNVASNDSLTEVTVPIRNMGGSAYLGTISYIILPSASTYSKTGFIDDNESIFISDIKLCVDMTSAAITDANTITAEMTEDTTDAENGFTGLRKLTVNDDSFYTLSSADRAIVHTFGTTVAQADVDYLGFWVKAPKAMNLALTFTDSYGIAVTTDVAVNGTLKQGGYRFVTLSREQLKLNYLADIVSLTLTPAVTADEFLADGEALLYSTFTLYSGKPVSFYASYKAGDANGNGAVDIRDLVRARAATDITYAADIIENGKIEAADIEALRNILLGIE